MYTNRFIYISEIILASIQRQKRRYQMLRLIVMASSIDKHNMWILYNHCLLSRVKGIPHICHFLYTGRIFKFQILHLKITQIYPTKSKICSFLRSIWKNLHPTEFFTRAVPVVPVTNMRYALLLFQEIQLTRSFLVLHSYVLFNPLFRGYLVITLSAC